MLISLLLLLQEMLSKLMLTKTKLTLTLQSLLLLLTYQNMKHLTTLL